MDESREPLVRVIDLVVSCYGRSKGVDSVVLDNISLVVEEGSVTALAGESGIGKSIFGKTISGLLPSGFFISGGTIEFGGREIGYDDLEKLRGKDVFYVPQDAAACLNPVIKIEKQIREGTKKNRRDCESILQQLNFSETDARKILSSYPFQLSGGENQRALIAMALIRDCRLLILDEPFSNLDEKNQQHAITLLTTLQKEKNLTILLITHKKNILKKIADKICTLE